MGTSVSQGSLRNTNWAAVHAGYINDFIPEHRIINEIWRASDREGMTELLQSGIIYECYSTVHKAETPQEALKSFGNLVLERQSNSLIAEFAKRAILGVFESKSPSSDWTARFFADVTNYIMSRDTSGFVGAGYRSKTVGDLVSFKQNILSKVYNIVISERKHITSQKDWNSFVSKSIKLLKTIEDE